jgi:hypothetical protein
LRGVSKAAMGYSANFCDNADAKTVNGNSLPKSQEPKYY